MKPPYKYQLKMTDFFITKGAVYFMVDCGLGKTRAVLMAIQRLKAKWSNAQAIVYAPPYPALDTWPSEIAKWAPELKYIVLHGPSKNHRCSSANAQDIIIIPYGSLPWFHSLCQAGKFPMKKYITVYDESSMIKDPNSKRTKMLHELMVLSSPYTACLSGTPAPNGLQDLWSQYFLLDKGKRLTKRFPWFRNRYFNYSGPPFFQTTIKSGAQQHVYDAISDITLRLNKEDYLELPELVSNNIPVKLSKTLMAKYRYLEEEFCLEFPEEDAVLASSAAALSSKLRQFLQGAIYTEQGVQHLHTEKAKLLKHIYNTSAGQPILAAIQFRFEYEIIKKVFRKDIPIIYGSTSRAQGQAYMRKWNRGELPLLLCHPASIGHGVNIQTGGNILVWLSLPWSLELYQQLIARLVRQGQKADRVIMHSLFVQGTKDEDVAKVLQRKDCTQLDLYRSLTNRR